MLTLLDELEQKLTQQALDLVAAHLEIETLKERLAQEQSQHDFWSSIDQEPNLQGLATCRGCSAKIIWAQTMSGKRIPLDPRPAIFSVTGNMRLEARRMEAVDSKGGAIRGFAVSHFATCPKASDFSGTKKEEEE